MVTRSNHGRIATISGVVGLIIAGAATASPTQNSVTVLSARPVEQRFTARVAYADLNLAQRSDRAILARRVDAAAHQVCRRASYQPAMSFDEESGCRGYVCTGAQPQIRQATKRAGQIAANGVSSIAPVAIAVSAAL